MTLDLIFVFPTLPFSVDSTDFWDATVSYLLSTLLFFLKRFLGLRCFSFSGFKRSHFVFFSEGFLGERRWEISSRENSKRILLERRFAWPPLCRILKVSNLRDWRAAIQWTIGGAMNGPRRAPAPLKFFYALYVV